MASLLTEINNLKPIQTDSKALIASSATLRRYVSDMKANGCPVTDASTGDLLERVFGVVTTSSVPQRGFESYRLLKLVPTLNGHFLRFRSFLSD